MPKPWSEVVGSEAYGELSDEQKSDAQLQYFRQVVMRNPQYEALDGTRKMEAMQQFFGTERPSMLMETLVALGVGAGAPAAERREKKALERIVKAGTRMGVTEPGQVIKAVAGTFELQVPEELGAKFPPGDPVERMAAMASYMALFGLWGKAVRPIVAAAGPRLGPYVGAAVKSLAVPAQREATKALTGGEPFNVKRAGTEAAILATISLTGAALRDPSLPIGRNIEKASVAIGRNLAKAARRVTGRELTPAQQTYIADVGVKTPEGRAFVQKLFKSFTKAERAGVERAMAEASGSTVAEARALMKTATATSLVPAPVVPPAPIAPAIAPALARPVIPAATVRAQDHTLEKFAKAIKEAKPIRGEVEALKIARRKKRAGVMREIFEKYTGEEAMKRASVAARGALIEPGEGDFEPIGNRFSVAEREMLNDIIREHPALENREYTKMRLGNVLKAVVDEGGVPTLGDIRLLEEVYGEEVAEALLGRRPPMEELKRVATEAAMLPKTALASFDLSGSLRQGAVLAITHPVKALSAYAAQLRAFASEEAALEIDRQIRTGGLAQVAEDAGLGLTRFEGVATPLSEREERFLGSMLPKKLAQMEMRGGKMLLAPLKLWGMGIEASERAYSTVLNKQRKDVFDAVGREMIAAGIDPAENMSAFNDLATLLNDATGRSEVKHLGGAVANFLTWSPRFIKSRMVYHANAMRIAAMPGTPGPLRKEALKQLVATTFAWLGLAATIKTAAKAFDWDIDMSLDPRSTNFLKMRVGKRTTVDLSHGFGPIFRLFARLGTGKTVWSTGRVKEADAWREITKAARYKLAPVPSGVVSVWTGKMPMGEKTTVRRILQSLAVPITFQEIEPLIREHGAKGLLFMIPEIHGVGVNVYDQDRTADLDAMIDAMMEQRK